jgi:predicted RNA-binding protein Jag
MSVSPYTIAFDYQVHEYNKRRAAYLASVKQSKDDRKQRKQEEKILRQAFARDRRMVLETLRGESFSIPCAAVTV